MNFLLQVTANPTDHVSDHRISSPNSHQVSSSSPASAGGGGVGAALAALGGLGGLFGTPLQMLNSLQAFQGQQGLQQLQQLAMLQQAGGNQMNPQAQFLFQNQVSSKYSFYNMIRIKSSY